MPPHWLHCVSLTWLSGTTKVGRESVCKGRFLPLPTLFHLGGRHLAALAIILPAESQVNPPVSAGDGGGDVHCLVGGDDPWLTVLAESTITSLIALSKSLSLFPGTLVVGGWGKLGRD